MYKVLSDSSEHRDIYDEMFLFICDMWPIKWLCNLVQT